MKTNAFPWISDASRRLQGERLAKARMWLVDGRLLSYGKGTAGFSTLGEGAARDDLQEGRKDREKLRGEGMCLI